MRTIPNALDLARRGRADRSGAWSATCGGGTTSRSASASCSASAGSKRTRASTCCCARWRAVRDHGALDGRPWRWVIARRRPVPPDARDARRGAGPRRRACASSGACRITRCTRGTSSRRSSCIRRSTKAARSSRSRRWRTAARSSRRRRAAFPTRCGPGENGWLVAPGDAVGARRGDQRRRLAIRRGSRTTASPAARSSSGSSRGRPRATPRSRCTASCSDRLSARMTATVSGVEPADLRTVARSGSCSRCSRPRCCGSGRCRRACRSASGVDEPEVMERAVRMMKTGDFNPHFFDYPTLYMYVQAVVAVVRFAVRRDAGHVERAGAGADRGVLRLGTRRHGDPRHRDGLDRLPRRPCAGAARTALLAAVMIAVMPLHVRESHYVLTDVPVDLLRDADVAALAARARAIDGVVVRAGRRGGGARRRDEVQRRRSRC